MSTISTHVLDTARGEPACGMVVRLERASGGETGTAAATANEANTAAGATAGELGLATTDADGRIADFGGADLPAGTYRLVFETRAYLAAAHGVPGEPPGSRGEPAGQQGGEPAAEPFFPEVVVNFTVDGRRPHYHVPLLLSPYSYSTYRGS